MQKYSATFIRLRDFCLENKIIKTKIHKQATLSLISLFLVPIILMILAILSPNENAYSETFIQAHRSLPFENFFYCNGRVPNRLAGTKRIVIIIYKIYFKLKSYVNNDFTPSEYSLKYLLKKKKIDCVLAEYGTTAAESLRVIQSLQLPLVVHFHGYDASDRDFLLKYKEKYIKVFTYAKSIISVSKKMTSDLIALGCPENKIILNTYGPSIDFYNIKPSFNTKQFIAIGRLVNKKAPHLTIVAFSKVAKKYPDARLLFGGEGHLLDDCKNLVKTLGLQEQVSFLGKQTKSQVMQHFSASLAFVQHSVTAENGDTEGTPVAVLEANAAGLPVIATRHAGIPDVIEHGKTGFLVEESDIEAMASYMIQLCENPEKAKQMGRQGSQNVLLNFSIEKHLQSLTDTINKAVEP